MMRSKAAPQLLDAITAVPNDIPNDAEPYASNLAGVYEDIRVANYAF